MHLVYYDERHGDRFEIFLTDDFTFESAQRFVDSRCNDPIHYNSLNDINTYHRNAIEALIWKHHKSSLDNARLPIKSR